MPGQDFNFNAKTAIISLIRHNYPVWVPIYCIPTVLRNMEELKNPHHTDLVPFYWKQFWFPPAFTSRVFFVRFCHGSYLFTRSSKDNALLMKTWCLSCSCVRVCVSRPLAPASILCNAHRGLYQMQRAVFLFQIVKILCSSFPLRLMKSTTMNPWEPTSTSSSSAWSWLVTDRWALEMEPVYRRVQTDVHKQVLWWVTVFVTGRFVFGVYKT